MENEAVFVVEKTRTRSLLVPQVDPRLEGCTNAQPLQDHKMQDAKLVRVHTY